MPARIYQPGKSAMTSGQAKSEGWVLEVAGSAAKPRDPLMGWTGQADTASQIKMSFATREAAEDYAARQGITAQIEESGGRKRRHRPRGYGDNFAYDRRQPWSH